MAFDPTIVETLHTVHNQAEFFGDEEIRAALGISRFVARFFILICVSLVSVYTLYGLILMIMAGGDNSKMERSREMLKNVFIGLGVSIGSYVIITTVIFFSLQVVGTPNTVLFWQSDVFEGEFGLDDLTDLPGGGEYALQGEILMFVGTQVVVCNSSLPAEADAAGWSWQPNLDATDLGGCVKP